MEPEATTRAGSPTEHEAGFLTENTGTMIRLLIGIAAVPALAIAYYFAIALPSYDKARLEIERQQLTQEQKRLEQAATQTKARDEGLAACLQKASDEYFSYMRLNGTVLGDGKVSTSQDVANAADKRKTDDRSACFKQFGGR